jgi:hypothetical protein
VGSRIHTVNGAQPFLRKKVCKQQEEFRDGLIWAPLVRFFQIRKESRAGKQLPAPLAHSPYPFPQPQHNSS